LLASEYNIAGEILNITSGSPINLTNLAKLILKIAGKENLNIKYTDPRPGDIKHSYGDISKAKRLIGFESKFNQEEGLRDYFAWYSEKYNVSLTKF
jgi:nucleoside-diphosphate-sugar epimerase